MHQEQGVTSPGGPEPSARSLLLIATLCGAQVLEVLGVTVVIVALPVVGADLRLDGGRLQLVVSLYAVLYGALLLTAGRLADVLGRRTVLLVGLGVTLLGALLCALAPTGTALLVGRAVQGVGGALVTPAALALLTATFPTGRPRRLAMSAWTAAAAGGGALGFGAGGVLVDALGWRAVFGVLAAVAVVVLAAAWAVPRDSHPGDTRAGRRPGLDPAGTATAVGGLVLLVVGTGMVQDPGPVPAPVVLVAAVALLALFLVTQRRGRDPLLPRAALTDRALLVPLGVAFVSTATTSASGTLVALVAADLLGLGARATGFVLLPFSVMVVVGSAAGGFWLRRPRHVGMAVGLIVVAVAMAGLAVATGARSAPLVAAAVAVAGLGLSWAAVTSTDAATAALPPAQQGTAAGAANTAAQVGTAVGVAVLLTVASLPRDAGTGFVVAFLCAAAVAAAASLALGLAARPRARTA